MEKIVVAADLHFGRGGKTGISQYSRTFEEMITRMIEQVPKYAVFAGDIFQKESAFTPETFHEILLSGFVKLLVAGCQVIIMAGNHDYDSTGAKHALAPFTRFKGIHVVDKIESISTDEYFMVFIPWITKVGLKALAVNTTLDAQDIVFEIHEKIVKPTIAKHVSDFKETMQMAKTSVCFFHASLVGFSPSDNEHMIAGTDFVLDPEYLESHGFAHVVGGHFHRRQVKGRTAYVGAMERADFGEKDNPNGFMVIEGGRREWIELQGGQKFKEIAWVLKGGDYAYIDGPKGFHIKLRPSMSRHDILDREFFRKQLMADGALSVVFEPEYTDEIQVRSDAIKAEAPAGEQLAVWVKENPDKGMNGLIEKLYAWEVETGFIAEDVFDVNAHVESFLKSNNGVTV